MRPKKVSDVFNSPTVSLARIRKEIGEDKGELYIVAFLTSIVSELVLYFNVGKNMNPDQVAQAVLLIADEFYYLKPDDFKLCFNRAKRGEYGEVYDRLDGQVIFKWLRAYCRERMNTAEEDSIQQAAVFKDNRGMQTKPLLDSILARGNKNGNNNK